MTNLFAWGKCSPKVEERSDGEEGLILRDVIRETFRICKELVHFFNGVYDKIRIQLVRRQKTISRTYIHLKRRPSPLCFQEDQTRPTVELPEWDLMPGLQVGR